ncbi:MAG: MFS transporter, partial [Oscillospiraceae bacterium]|nr:MFS transporter [Oscillospiraceae bacterium]
MRKNKRLMAVLALCWLTYVFAYLCRLNLSTVLDKASVGLNVSVEYLGIASSLYFGTYAVGQLLNGIVGDRVSPHKFVMLALIMTGVINVTLGLQSSGTAFLIMWGLNGFCQSMFWSTLLRLLSFYSGPNEKKGVSTVMTTCSVTGYFMSWIVLGYVFKPMTFRPYFFVPGILALCLVPLWFVLSGKLEFSKAVAERAKTPPLPVVAREFVHDRLYFVCFL